MATQSAVAPASKGICTFCNAEVAKNKMTQHLKFCKARLATIAAQEEKSQKKKSQEKKTRMFHILAEGKYSPEYWLHFEVPASEPLWILDSFIKDMWIDDLDHLSGFTINGTDYSTDYPTEFFSFSEVEEAETEEEMSEEEQAQEIKRFIDEVITIVTEGYTPYLEALSLSVEEVLWPEWIAEVKKPRSLDELVNFLKEELKRITKEERSMWSAKQDISREIQRTTLLTSQYQKSIVDKLLGELEDTSMDVALQRVLKVGQKFSYVYDYGSSTYINLKVIAEREGIVANKKEPVQLLARNIAETFPCAACGKPATTVEMGYFWGSIAESAFCTKCAKERIDEERGLPIINSPRVGVL